jgi:hypothetical protein
MAVDKENHQGLRGQAAKRMLAFGASVIHQS